MNNVAGVTIGIFLLLSNRCFMQFFGLLIPIIIGYFADEMFTGVIIGSLFWLVAWSIAKQRQEERLAESATAGDRMQKLEQEIELLKQRLSVLEHEAVRDEAKVGQGLEVWPVADVQTASEPLHVRVESEAEAAPVKQKIEEAFAPSFLYLLILYLPRLLLRLSLLWKKLSRRLLRLSLHKKSFLRKRLLLLRCRLKMKMRHRVNSLSIKLSRKAESTNFPIIRLLLGSCAAIRC